MKLGVDDSGDRGQVVATLMPPQVEVWEEIADHAGPFVGVVQKSIFIGFINFWP